MANRKRLFYDLEVSPNTGFFWQSGHQISVGYESITKERAVICACDKPVKVSEQIVSYLDSNPIAKEIQTYFLEQ